MEKAEQIWMNGKYIPWNDAKIHVLSHQKAKNKSSEEK